MELRRVDLLFVVKEGHFLETRRRPETEEATWQMIERKIYA